MVSASYYNEHYGLAGLSDGGLTDMNKSQLASFATATAGGLTAASLALVGLGPIGAVVAIGTQLAALVVRQFNGCGQSCILTSNAANQIEQLLNRNVTAYFQSPRTTDIQIAALQNFDDTWSKLVQFCGNPEFGTAGKNCIQDRLESACQWKATPGRFDGCNWIPAGPNGSGNSCWNWFIGYRDPIANDPCVHTNTVQSSLVSSNIGQAIGNTFGINPILALGIGALGLGLLLNR